MFESTNLEKELRALQSRTTDSQNFVDEILRGISEKAEAENRINDALGEGNNADRNNFNIDLLETDKIYHIDTIRKICIDYRLRFLDTKYFRNEFPQEAIDKISNLEKDHNTKIEGFKIMAPSKLFRLENPDDPLLFAPIGNGYYYLIHKWGNDLSPFRKLLVAPVKNLDNLMLSALVFSVLISYAFNSFLSLKDENFISNFFLIFLFNFKCVIAVIMFYAIPRGKSVNESIWDSVYNR